MVNPLHFILSISLRLNIVLVGVSDIGSWLVERQKEVQITLPVSWQRSKTALAKCLFILLFILSSLPWGWGCSFVVLVYLIPKVNEDLQGKSPRFVFRSAGIWRTDQLSHDPIFQLRLLNMLLSLSVSIMQFPKQLLVSYFISRW